MVDLVMDGEELKNERQFTIDDRRQMSTQDAILVAKKFILEVSKEFPVGKAYVFGSFAKGKADENSDIDVCIVSSAFGKNYLTEEMELVGMSMGVDERLSPVAFSPEDIADKYSQLAHEITEYGIVL